VSRILLVGEEGISPERLRENVASALPPEAEALTGEEMIADTQDAVEADFLGFFETFLLMFAAVALLVATFSIHNTFSILVAQRTRESALLRAIGASRGQVLRSICAEGLALGIVASGIGLGAGIGVGYGLRALIESFGVELPNAGLVVTTGTIVAALVVGVAVTFLASVSPAVKGSRVAPLAALRDNANDRSGSSKWRAAFGVLALGSGIALTITAVTNSAIANFGGALGRAGLGALATLVGAVALGPVVARPASALLGSPLAAFRGSGRLARRNAMRNPRRTSGSASALMVGTAVVALFTTVGASVKASIGDVIDRSFDGDLVIVDESFSGAGLSPRLADELLALPEVAATAPMTNAVVNIDGDDEYPTAVEPERLGAVFDLDESSGLVADLEPGQIAVSDVYAREHALSVGSRLTFEYADGASETLAIGAVYRGGEIVGDIVMTRADWTPHATRATDVAVLIDLADGVSLEAGQAAVQRVADRVAAPDPQTGEEYIDSVAAEVDQMLALVYGLLGLAVLIALMGIANTLSLSIHERTRELGLLRAVGQTRRQLRSTVRWEAVIVSVFGTIGGLGLGTFLGWGLIEAIAAEEGFGTFSIPVGPLAAILALAAGAGVVAAVRPARRAAKLDILSAIATDRGA
jgi:putative ABC transport system permease protein